MTNRKKKKQKPSGGSPSTSSRSESSETKSYPPTLEVDASTVARSSPMNESQLLGRAAAVADESGNSNPQISATVEIVPEEVGPEATSTQTMPVVPSSVIAPPTVENLNTQSPQEGVKTQAALWKDKVSPNSGKLEPEGTPFILDSGEACVKIPNAVIEKNRKAWDSFIIGKFYEEAPARGAIHAIVDGQTMFVAKWSPGVKPEKPALSTEIAGLVAPTGGLGHTISKCPAAPPRCEHCRSVKHSSEACTRQNVPQRAGKAPIASQYPIVGTSKTQNMHNAPAKVPAPDLRGKQKSKKQWVRPESIKRPLIIEEAPLKQSGPSKELAAPTHDLEEGEIFVDFRNLELSSASPKSSTSLDEDDPGSEGFSNEEDDPHDLADQYIKVISRRSQKKARAIARARGPLIL
ncbi:BnaC02g25100D [Brassica napus]|uniref:(rape) hypothetical protein n=1 Tax=Brassica napus TaxID=3708 RepID=A0A078FQK6_BRANA|nr:unnamed protein product [Brassica napus]CDY14603.1 BnaC02g25100D [Brassica napus]